METPFCDRMRSCDHDRTISEDRTIQLRSCDHMETKLLRSAIEIHPRASVQSNVRHAAIREDGSVSKETLMKVVALYGCLFYRNSKYLNDINKKRNRMGMNWKDIQEKCGRCEGKILFYQTSLWTIDTVANENATTSIAAIFCSLRNLHFTDQLKPQVAYSP